MLVYRLLKWIMPSRVSVLVQWWRFGGLARAPLLDTAFAWAGCAGAAVFVAWRLTQRRR